MFNESKYTRWYYSIVESARCQPNRGSYTEKHHIIPRCMGGTNEKSNLVNLTYREHFICHWLLTKMVIERNHIRSMKYALAYMRRSGATPRRNMTAWQFEIVKTARKNVSMSEEQKAKLRQVRRSPEVRAKIAESQRKRLSDPKAREVLAAAHRGKKLSPEHARAISRSHTGVSRSKSFKDQVKGWAGKRWRVTYIDGRVDEFISLSDYAKLNDLTYTLLHKMYSTGTGRSNLGISSIIQMHRWDPSLQAGSHPV
jgi:hypothetical protein